MFTCELCDKQIEDEDDMHADDSGEYHNTCHTAEFNRQRAYWLPLYRGELRATEEL